MSIYLGLGSNIGNRKENLNRVLELLEERGISVISRSSVYETEPVGFKQQSDFYNQVVKVKTNLSPEELLSELKQIESDMGRKAAFKNTPRVIDIDILIFNDVIIKSKQLEIPHKEIENRAFVIKPLLEIAPEAELAGGRKVKDLKIPNQRAVVV